MDSHLTNQLTNHGYHWITELLLCPRVKLHLVLPQTRYGWTRWKILTAGSGWQAQSLPAGSSVQSGTSLKKGQIFRNKVMHKFPDITPKITFGWTRPDSRLCSALTARGQAKRRCDPPSGCPSRAGGSGAGFCCSTREAGVQGCKHCGPGMQTSYG